MMKDVVILNFSPRNDGNCAHISDYLCKAYNRTNVLTYSICADNFQPCRNCNYECLKPEETCPQVDDYQAEVMRAVCESEVTYYIVPNFCGYPCSNYFAFNERSVGYFHMDRNLMVQYMNAPKKFIIVSNSDGAAFTEAMQQQTFGKPQILFMKSGKYGKQSIAGDLLTSDEAIADLQAFIEDRSEIRRKDS